MAAQPQEAYATLLVTDNYLPGAMVLAHSLRDNGTKKLLVALVTLDTVSGATVAELANVYDQVIPVERIVNKSPANLYLMERPDLGSTFTKIALWRQTQFSRLVYIDADIVAIRAPDELFSRPSSFAAAPDVGWPDCFNSGVMALTPNMGDYYALLALAQRGISFDGADQGLLNMHFGNYDRLSFTYNCTPSGHYQYVPAYRHFQSSISMVHYIGREKPWLVGREGKGSTGAYEELLGRWWAVYDKHYRYPTTAAISGQAPSTKRIVQQYVLGEAYATDYGLSSSLTSTEPSPPPVSEVESDHSAAAPQAFAAPFSEWDPTSQPPPTQSRPEAANFPTHQYTMSADRSLFQAPKSYPEPPRDLWYEVPKTPPTNERPAPIFPWETTQSKPTRVFANDPPSPEAQSTPSAINTNIPGTTGEGSVTPTIKVTSDAPFSSYARTNAWDDLPAIERYVTAMNSARRGKVQVVSNSPGRELPADEVLSPSTESPSRRPSMKLTDFPTEIERPSLPVTPAPVRRPSFWGQERNDLGELPGAEGVPKQEDWDPLKKLEELQRRQSEVLASGPLSPSNELPDRKQLESAVLLPTSEETDVPQTSVSTASNTAPSQSNVGFDSDAKSGADEGVFDPTPTG